MTVYTLYLYNIKKIYINFHIFMSKIYFFNENTEYDPFSLPYNYLLRLNIRIERRKKLLCLSFVFLSMS